MAEWRPMKPWGIVEVSDSWLTPCVIYPWESPERELLVWDGILETHSFDSLGEMFDSLRSE